MGHKPGTKPGDADYNPVAPLTGAERTAIAAWLVSKGSPFNAAQLLSQSDAYLIEHYLSVYDQYAHHGHPSGNPIGNTGKAIGEGVQNVPGAIGGWIEQYAVRFGEVAIGIILIAVGINAALKNKPRQTVTRFKPTSLGGLGSARNG